MKQVSEISAMFGRQPCGHPYTSIFMDTKTHKIGCQDCQTSNQIIMPLDGSNERKEITMFEKWVPPSVGRGSYQAKFKGQLVVAVNKGYIWVSPETFKVLGMPGYICVMQNNTEWALKASSEDETGAYSTDSHGSHKPGQVVVRAGSFIKMCNMPVGYIYKGRLQDGMVVFSKTPNEKA
jgi:hypothetical protein